MTQIPEMQTIVCVKCIYVIFCAIYIRKIERIVIGPVSWKYLFGRDKYVFT